MERPVNASSAEDQGLYPDYPVDGLGNLEIYYPDPEKILQPWVNEPHYFYTMAVYGITFLTGVVGNALVIFAVCGDRKSRSVTTSFMVSLAVADLLFLLVCAPYEMSKYFIGHWPGGSFLCKLSSFVEMLSAVASILNLTSISVERYIVIVHPMLSRWWCTVGNTKKILPGVWLISVLLCLPSIFVMDIEKIIYYNNETSVTVLFCYDIGIPIEHRFVYTIYQFGIMFAAPTIIMIVCYACVIHVLWLSSKQLKSMTSTSSNSANTVSEDVDSKRVLMSPSASQLSSGGRSTSHRSRRSLLKMATKVHSAEILKARKQVIKMLITIIVAFLLCWGPKLILRILQRMELDVLRDLKASLFVKLVIDWLPYIQSCSNPIIYGFMSRNFRKSMRTACQDLVCRTYDGHMCLGRRIYGSDYEMESRSSNGTVHTKISLRTKESVSSDEN